MITLPLLCAAIVKSDHKWDVSLEVNWHVLWTTVSVSISVTKITYTKI